MGTSLPKRLEIHNIAAYVTAHGDDHSGAILIKVIKMDGSAQLYQKTFDLQSNKNAWVRILEGLDMEIDSLLEKQKVNDPDLWVIGSRKCWWSKLPRRVLVIILAL